MSGSYFAQDAENQGPGKPRNKRRYGAGKSKKRPDALERIRARRDEPALDDDFLDDFDDDIDIDDDDDDFEDELDGWDFEDDDER